MQAKRDLNGSLEGTAVGEKVSLPVGIKEINALKESIQLLCQSTNPLGKTLDYVQEDIDAMNKEIDIWKIEGEKYDSQLKEKDEYEYLLIVGPKGMR